mmetsp:Transcript_35649/g.81309  ORF Transcript_35649/g.81309 Transcript_35649/m.81309 type:complete len:233 (+) Transcript_35649:574-1272(+)
MPPYRLAAPSSRRLLAFKKPVVGRLSPRVNDALSISMGRPISLDASMSWPRTATAVVSPAMAGGMPGKAPTSAASMALSSSASACVTRVSALATVTTCVCRRPASAATVRASRAATSDVPPTLPANPNVSAWNPDDVAPDAESAVPSESKPSSVATPSASVGAAELASLPMLASAPMSWCSESVSRTETAAAACTLATIFLLSAEPVVVARSSRLFLPLDLATADTSCSAAV